MFVGFIIEYNDIRFGDKVGQGCYGTVHKVWKGETVAPKWINVPSDMVVAQIVAHSDEIAALSYCNEHTQVTHKRLGSNPDYTGLT